MVRDEPDLGPHHRGTVLVYRGRLLDVANEWQDLWLRSRHEESEETQFAVPPAFSNFMSALQDAANARGEGDTLARITACVRECRPVASGGTRGLRPGTNPICFSVTLPCPYLTPRTASYRQVN